MTLTSRAVSFVWPYTSCLIMALLTTVLVTFTIGFAWGFVFLAAFWLSANVVFWFKRHPPPPSAFRGGRDD
ncbi:MAG: hypothetical protein AAGG69_00205 [Pseudomonadota bacterium]